MTINKKELIEELQKLKLMIDYINNDIYDLHSANLQEIHEDIAQIINYLKCDMEDKVDEIIEQIKGEQE